MNTTQRYQQLKDLLNIDPTKVSQYIKAYINLMDFICTDNNKYYYFDQKYIYKTVMMFGAKTLCLNRQTGRISTRNGWECLNKLKLTVIE